MTIFTEKYRPKTRNELIGNKDSIKKIFELVDSKNLTHMIFEGYQGTGKTSTVMVIAHELYGENIEANFLKINASDENKLDTVLPRVKAFGKNKAFNAERKTVFLDEAERLTSAVQQSFRSLMEELSENLIFIYGVNHVEQIIEPIQSRCNVFRFGPISTEEISDRLRMVYHLETGLDENETTYPINVKACNLIADRSHGDMRKAVNMLQLIMSSGKALSPELVSSTEVPNYGKTIFSLLKIGRFIEAKKSLTEALELGFRERSIIASIHQEILGDNILVEQKRDIIFALCEMDYRMTQGVNKELAMHSLFFTIIEVVKNAKK